MSDDFFIEIRPGRRTQTEGEYLTEPGVYQAGLVEVSDPWTFVPKAGFNAGEEVTRISWVFAVEDDDAHDGQLIEYLTSAATGPKSNMYALLTALFGGKAPPVGTKLEKRQLIGRSVQLTLAYNGDYLNVTNVAAIRSKASPKPAAAADTSDDSLPF